MKASTLVFGILLMLAGRASATDNHCTLFEVEVFAIDGSSELQPIANFAQSLPEAQNWKMTSDLGAIQSDLAGVRFDATITWNSPENALAPTVDLVLMQNGREGRVKLTEILWQALYGPEAFTQPDSSAFILTGLGRPIAVASVTAIDCPDG